MPVRLHSSTAPTAPRAVLDPNTARRWPELQSYERDFDRDYELDSYDDYAEVPAMMDAQAEECLPRPSLLAFKPSRMLRVSQQQQQNALYKQQLLQALANANTNANGTTTATDQDDDWYESSEASEDERSVGSSAASPVRRVTRAPSAVPEENEGEDEGEGEAVRTTEQEGADDGAQPRSSRAVSLIACMSMPLSGTIPLLETLEGEEGDNDIDTIICDPTRLPRTLIVDEDGFSISRESVMARAANVPRGGVIKSGLLFKQGFGLRAGGWKVRYVVLTSSKMTFFREEHGRKRGEIDLSKCTGKSIEIMPRDSVFDGSQATMWRFAIRGKNRRVLLSAYTEAEMKDWLRCLHVALAAQGHGFGRYTDFVVPSGTFLAGKSGGLLRSSGNL